MVWAQPRGDLGGEAIIADDVVLWQANANWSWEIPAAGWRGDLSVAHNRFEIDYQPVPFDFRGSDVQRRESATAVQANARWRRGETLEWLGSAGVHAGFTNYRSVWLAEYFRQQFEPLGNTAPDRYRAPDPRGASAGVGMRWEYLRSSGFLQIVATGLRDEVAPGYEIDFAGVRRGRESLNGMTVAVSTENLLSPTTRTKLEVRSTRISERETRWSGELALNQAVGERVVLRTALGGATEDPKFHAWYARMTVDVVITDRLAVFAQGRYYVDTGEIENSLLFTSAAPGLHSRQIGLGLRWRDDRQAVRLLVAALHSDHDPTNPRLDFFQNLYRDRHWTVVQVGYSRNF